MLNICNIQEVLVTSKKRTKKHNRTDNVRNRQSKNVTYHFALLYYKVSESWKSQQKCEEEETLCSVIQS